MQANKVRVTKEQATLTCERTLLWLNDRLLQAAIQLGQRGEWSHENTFFAVQQELVRNPVYFLSPLFISLSGHRNVRGRRLSHLRTFRRSSNLLEACLSVHCRSRHYELDLPSYSRRCGNQERRGMRALSARMVGKSNTFPEGGHATALYAICENVSTST